MFVLQSVSGNNLFFFAEMERQLFWSNISQRWAFECRWAIWTCIASALSRDIPTSSWFILMDYTTPRCRWVLWLQTKDSLTNTIVMPELVSCDRPLVSNLLYTRGHTAVSHLHAGRQDDGVRVLYRVGTFDGQHRAQCLWLFMGLTRIFRLHRLDSGFSCILFVNLGLWRYIRGRGMGILRTVYPPPSLGACTRMSGLCLGAEFEEEAAQAGK